MRNYFLLLLVFLSSHIFYGQKDSIVLNPRAIQKTGFDFRLFGPTVLLAFEGNHFINQNINIQGGIGLIGFYGGIQYYHGRKDKKNLIVPYSGFNLAYFYLPDFGPGSGGGYGLPSCYIPLGFQLMTKNGFHISLEGALFLQNTNDPSLAAYVFYQGDFVSIQTWGSFKIGKNF